ncbi:MFS transporter [Shouchella clausii]|nr:MULTISPECIES: MFS transporter [Shouchella]MDO7281796.1 MFS transporter [Shouchella clausii]MDO7301891.1 MFS transporter [Shouchella clausii]MDP0465303.1 MFS transporter [Shouchella rhizosphaerae]MDP5259712.1 MFS transporter [Shouchella clausii]MDP5265544.1 MFS transporter [Shouchella clausii]
MVGKTKKTWGLLSLASVPLVMTLGNSMLIPVLPTIGKQLQISSFMVSLLITVYSVVAIVFIPIAGYISDHVGRKPVIVPSLIIAGIGGLMAGLAAWKMDNAYWVILIGRLLQGIGAAGASPIVMPFVGDLFKNNQDVSEGLGIIETANTFGKVLSPIFGAVLASIIWYLPFFSFPIFCFVSIFLVLFLVESPPLAKKPTNLTRFLKSMKKIFKREGRWLYVVFFVGGMCMYILFGVLFYLSSFLEEAHHIDGIRKGVILAFPLMALCLTSYGTGRIIGQDQIKMKWMTVAGLCLLAVSTFVVSFNKELYVMLTALFAAGVGIGAALPSLDAFVTEGIPMEQRGSVTSFYNSMRFVGVAIGPPLFALFMKGNHFWTFAGNALLVVLSVLLVFWGVRPHKKVSQTWQ